MADAPNLVPRARTRLSEYKPSAGLLAQQLLEAREEIARLRSGKIPGGGGGVVEEMGSPSREPHGSGSSSDISPQVSRERSLPGGVATDGETLAASLAAGTREAMDLQRRIVAIGARLMSQLERSSTLRALREVGAAQVFGEAAKAAKALMDAQLRVDEAALRARGDVGAVAEILRRLESVDAA